MDKAQRLLQLAQKLADERPEFFKIKGPGAGDRDTQSYMNELRRHAAATFGEDYGERRICGNNNLVVDFFFPEERTIIEVALGLRNPASEYERDILKAIMAQEAGHCVERLLFIGKPGAKKRLGQPAALAIASWTERNHGIKVEVHELRNRHAV